MADRLVSEEKPFDGLDIYFSGSIKGVPHPDPNFFWDLVQHMEGKGGNVMSEHVAARTPGEMDDIFAKRSGIDRRLIPEPWFVARRVDIEWVDKATHVVAVVDGASTGVGSEIQRAFDKHRMGMNLTPVLCLVHESKWDEGLTWMVKGISDEDSPVAEVRTYKDTKDAQLIIDDFLMRHR